MAFLKRVRTQLLKCSTSFVAGVVALYLLFGLLQAWRLGALPEGSLPDAAPFYSPAALAVLLSALQPEAPLYAVTAWVVDAPFAIAYAVLLALLLVRAPDWGRWWSRAWLLPFAAAGFDVAENTLVGFLAVTFPSTPVALAWTAAICTAAKWALLTASVALVVAAGVREPRELGWWSAGVVWLVVVAYMMTLGPVAVLAWLAVLAVVVHLKWLYLGQYLFFLRFPLFVALVFALLPQISGYDGPGLLVGNLFVLESGLQMFSVGAVAGITAMALMSAARMVYLLAPERTEICLLRAANMGPRLREARRALLDAPDEAKRRAARVEVRRLLRMENQDTFGGLFPWASRARPLVFALLAFPVVLEITERAPEPMMHGALAAAGLAAAVVLGYLILKLEGRWLEERIEFNATKRVGQAMGDPIQDAMVGLRNPVGALGVLAVFVYAALPLFVGPTSSGAAAQGFPAILYLFLILIVLTWLLTLVSLRADVSRMPVVLTAVIVLFALFQLSDSDHRYEVMPKPAGWDLPSAAEVVRASLRDDSLRRADAGRDPRRDYLIAVAASGGGIKASLWTARVLEGLSEALGDDFDNAVVLMSTNSGGSVGGMYYSEAFTPKGGPSREVLEDIVEAAGASSLSATVWGMAYPDLLRFVSGGLLMRDGWRARDRGWAMDRTWESYRRGFADSPEGRPRRLGDWVEGVRSGWRPAHIFNATLVETGAAMRFSTVDLGSADADAPGSVPREFDDLFDREDIDLATAARLSASFPWVSPIASGWMHPDSLALVATSEAAQDSLRQKQAASAFHITDGGFFDNFGVYSALEFLTDVGPDSLRAMGVDKVALVQIRASPEKPGSPRFGGLTYSVAGPIIAMNSVRTSSQIGRNQIAIGQLADSWNRQGVTLCSLLFELEEAGPLSWHLSTEEQARLRAAWSPEHEQAADRLGRFLRRADVVQAGRSAPDPACG